MSGGSYEYAYRHVDDMACSVARRVDNPLRQAFAAHLSLVAKAMHAVEWVDSGDYGPGDEDEAIRKVLAPGAELLAAVAQAERARDMLLAVLDAAAGLRQSVEPSRKTGESK